MALHAHSEVSHQTNIIPHTHTIDWTAFSQWNPITGCDSASEGCDNCYAHTLTERLRGTAAFPKGFDLTHHWDRLDKPFKMKKPTLIFIDSMSDIFLKRVRRDFLNRIFDEMERARWHTYQILTKRSALMKYVNDRYRRCAPRNMSFGVSMEKPEYAFRIQHLRETNCAARFLSCEPVLEALPSLNLDRVDQVIVGGECARQPRLMKEEWAVDLRD